MAHLGRSSCGRSLRNFSIRWLSNGYLELSPIRLPGICLVPRRHGLDGGEGPDGADCCGEVS